MAPHLHILLRRNAAKLLLHCVERLGGDIRDDNCIDAIQHFVRRKEACDEQI